MSCRPSDWSPLAGGDPVPGDPEAVSRLARRYRDIADDIAEQSGNLRRLATAEGFDSDAGRTFGKKAGEVAAKLAKARARYAGAAEALRAWAPELRHAQSVAGDALAKARAAQAEIDANRPAPVVSPPGGEEPSPAEEAAAKRRDAAYDAGVAALNRARDQFADAVDHYRQHGRRIAGMIREVIDNDGLKDSGWDKFKNAVSKVAHILKTIADIAGWVATALAVIAVVLAFTVFAPIVGTLLALAALATAVALFCHTLLALSGDGSWLDVVIDVVGLVTFGYGKVAGPGLKAAVNATRKAAANTARREASRAVRNASRAQIKDLSRRVTARSTSAASRRAARRQLAQIRSRAGRAGNAAAREVRTAPLARPSLRDLRWVDAELLGDVAEVGRWTARFPNAARVRANADEALAIARRIRNVSGTGAAVEIADRDTMIGVEGMPGSFDLTGPLPDKHSLFDPIKPYFTREIGAW